MGCSSTKDQRAPEGAIFDAKTGETFSLYFVVTDRSVDPPVPVDLAGHTIAAAASTRPGDPPAVAATSEVSPEGGAFVYFDTTGLAPANYHFDVKITSPDGYVVFQMVDAILRVTRGVTA